MGLKKKKNPKHPNYQNKTQLKKSCPGLKTYNPFSLTPFNNPAAGIMFNSSIKAPRMAIGADTDLKYWISTRPDLILSPIRGVDFDGHATNLERKR